MKDGSGEAEGLGGADGAPRLDVGWVETISIFPVKGLGGVDVLSADVLPWGLNSDRLWCVVDKAGVFLSQRQIPGMAAVTATPCAGGVVLVDGHGGSAFVENPGLRAPRAAMRIWRDRLDASVADDLSNRWLSDRLSTSCRLVRMIDPATDRGIGKPEAGREDVVSFADGFPVLCAGTASLASLRSRVGDPSVPMSRFRANLVFRTAVPWAELGWTLVLAGGATFEAVRPCVRCPVIDVDQAAGVVDGSARLLRALSRASDGKRKIPEFGCNLIPRQLGTVRVGDVVSAC